MIAVSVPLLGELEEKLVLEVLRSGRLVQGPMVERFEQAVAEAVDAPYAVAVNNGTSALLAALLAHDIGPGDEVITSPFTFVATLNAILLVGATPRFVDIGDDFLMDTSQVAAAIGPATRAILPVHLYGLAVDVAALREAIGDRPIVIVGDGAQALGASQHGRPVGADATTTFSFYATKNVTTGEGGVVTTPHDNVAAALRQLRNQGQRDRYDYAVVGQNLRMTELQAALGVAQMQRLPQILAARRRNAARLAHGLAGIDGLVLPSEPPDRRHVLHQFTVRVTDRAAVTRKALADHLACRGIQAAVYYPRPVYDYPVFRADPRVGAPSTPVTERVCREVLSLPIHPQLTDAELDTVVAAVREVTT